MKAGWYWWAMTKRRRSAVTGERGCEYGRTHFCRIHGSNKLLMASHVADVLEKSHGANGRRWGGPRRLVMVDVDISRLISIGTFGNRQVYAEGLVPSNLVEKPELEFPDGRLIIGVIE